MNVGRTLATLTQLTRDTFRQAWASGISVMMLAVTALCVLLCLSVSVSGDKKLFDSEEHSLILPKTPPADFARSVAVVLSSSGPLETVTTTAASHKLVWHPEKVAKEEGVVKPSGRMALAFGAVPFDLARERGDAVRFLELLLAGGIAGSFGLLMALVWTAGFLPTFLEPSAASVLLAKPVGRWLLLVGKYVGVLTFVSFQVVLFVVLTWLALGCRTGVWDMRCWWCIPLLVLEFAALYSFSVLLAVVTRSTVACVFGSFLFWLLAWGINYGSVMASRMQDSQHLSPVTVTLTQAAYWISPKPIDAGLILFNALDAKTDFGKPLIFQHLESWSGYSPQGSLLSSLAIAAVLLALSGYELNTKDY